MAQLRITGGELRGRRLHAPGSGIRPTSGRVREALFSMLGDVSGLKVLDLFCGTGALGIEALSRGASEATFVDKRIAAVRRNLEELGLADREGKAAVVIRADVGDHLFRSAVLGSMLFDLVFCDPPYRLALGLDSELDAGIPAVLEEGARVVVETAARNPLWLSYPLLKEREYGDTLLRIYSAPKPRAGRQST